VVERIFEHRIRQQIKIDDMQFGFMKGKGTTDAIFMARQMQESLNRVPPSDRPTTPSRRPPATHRESADGPVRRAETCCVV